MGELKNDSKRNINVCIDTNFPEKNFFKLMEELGVKETDVGLSKDFLEGLGEYKEEEENEGSMLERRQKLDLKLLNINLDEFKDEEIDKKMKYRIKRFHKIDNY